MRRDGLEAFAPVARRIRARAEHLLAGLPVEDPDVVWARRAALLHEMGFNGPWPLPVPAATTDPNPEEPCITRLPEPCGGPQLLSGVALPLRLSRPPWML